MPRFQKRPVEVEIRRANGTETIETREGTLTAKEADGDLVITGVEGEVYPIDARILAKTYVPMDEDAKELYDECLPKGVVVDFKEQSVIPEGGTAWFVSGIFVDGPLDDEERMEAEEFCREFIAGSPHLTGDVAYRV